MSNPQRKKVSKNDSKDRKKIILRGKMLSTATSSNNSAIMYRGTPSTGGIRKPYWYKPGKIIL